MSLLGEILHFLGCDKQAPQAVDVTPILDQKAREHFATTGEHLAWRVSIVDLLKLVGIDSDKTNRQKLAKELGFKGNMRDDEAMNVWLHCAVMQQIAQNGGTVPAGLL